MGDGDNGGRAAVEVGTAGVRVIVAVIVAVWVGAAVGGTVKTVGEIV